MRAGRDVHDLLADAIAQRGPLLMVVAHPDDDILGAGALLARLRRVQIAYVTDGAPRDGQDARAHGFATVEDYAAARRREAREALELAGVDPDQTFWLEVPDQQATFQLDRIVRRLGELVAAASPRLVLTHAYEGGHPDHDAVAFAVHAALARLDRAAGAAPPLLEFAGYRAGAAGGRDTSFLRREDCPEATLVLSDADRRLKAAMLARHASQASVLAGFTIEREAFRVAPAYDFSQPPHPGPLLYEQAGFGATWGIDGGRWREEAGAAARALGVP